MELEQAKAELRQIRAKIEWVMARAICRTCAHGPGGFSGPGQTGKCTVGKRMKAVTAGGSCECHEFNAHHYAEEQQLAELMPRYVELCRQLRQ
jgi:hypothetical protein